MLSNYPILAFRGFAAFSLITSTVADRHISAEAINNGEVVYAAETDTYLPTLSVFLFPEDNNVKLFNNRSALENSAQAKSCEATNPCFSICNENKQVIYVLAEFNFDWAGIWGAHVQYPGKLNEPQLRIPPGKCTLIPGLPNQDYRLQPNQNVGGHNSAIRAHFGCQDEGKCRGPENIITKVELAHGRNKTNVGANLSLVDGYNMGARLSFGTAVDRTLSVYIPPRRLKRICPKKNTFGEDHGVAMMCFSDCMITNSDKDCCRGDYGPGQKFDCPASSDFFKPYAGQAFRWAYNDKAKFRQFENGPIISVTFGPQKEINPKGVPESDGTFAEYDIGEAKMSAFHWMMVDWYEEMLENIRRKRT